MNKKLVFGAVLLGAMTLTSCVDDTESASVTAIRQAKAEQLQSLADLNKANADAALIQANAYKAAQEAIAAYNEAMKAEAQARAAYLQAQADYEAARTEIARDEARQRAEQAAVTLEESKAKLENYKKQLASLDAQYERDLYDNMLKALEAKEAYEAAIKTEDQKTQAKLLALLENYQKENDELLDLRSTLNTWKMQLARLEAGLISPNQSAELNIAYYNRDINSYKERIAEAQAYITTWNTVEFADAQTALEQAGKDRQALTKAKSDAQTAKNEADNTASNAMYALNSSAYVQSAEDLKNEYAYFNSVQIRFIDEWNTTSQWNDFYGAPAAAIDNWCAVIESYDQQANDWVKSYIPLFTNNNPEYKYYTYQLIGNSGNTQIPYEYYDSYYTLLEGGLDEYVTALETSLAEGQEKNATDAAKRLEDAQKGVTDAEKALSDAEAREKAQQDTADAYNNRPADTTAEKEAELLKAMQDAQTAYDEGIKVWQAEDDVTTAKQELNAATKNKNAADNDLAAMKQKLTEIKGLVATLKKDAATVAANVKTVNEDNLAFAKAEADYNIADNKLSQKNSEISALELIVNGTDDNGYGIKWQVEQKEEQIKNYEKQIASLEDQKAMAEKDLAAGKVSQDNQIAELKANIENQEAKVLAQEKITEAAKKALDDAMAEETPAE